MSDARRERVLSLFSQAIERPLDERGAWLDEACGGDAELRREIDELLAFDRSEAGASIRVLEAPAATTGEPRAMPERIGRYTVDRVLGEGGMGVVYAAHDPTLGRTVALKLVRGGASAASRARLLREAQAMARIASPFVVPVYEVDVAGHDVFVAMEHVDGVTLAEWLDTASPSDEAIVRRFVEAGRGLAAAHEAGVLHRDFKAANVLIGADQRARVVDFGLARGARFSTDDGTSSSQALLDDGLTAHGAIMGTPGYLSPEHFSGAFVPASDQWSYCAALYRALFSRLPCAGDSIAAMREAVSRGPAPPPSLRAAELDPSLTDAVLRGLSPDPSARWPSMTALVDALEATIALSSDADPRAFMRQKRRALSIVGALGTLNYVVQIARTKGRFDNYVIFQSIAIALVVFLIVCAVLRKTLFATRHNRALLFCFGLTLGSMVVHRAYAIARNLETDDVLRVDALVALALSALGAVTLERWLWGTAAVMAGYLALSALGSLATHALFPLTLLASVALAVWNWRPHARRAPARSGSATLEAKTEATMTAPSDSAQPRGGS